MKTVSPAALVHGLTVFIFNNVSWNYMHGYPSPDGTNCYQPINPSGGTFYFTDNTTDSPCSWSASNGSATGENNHFIGFSVSTFENWVGSSHFGADNGGQLFQSEAVANAQGYTASNGYAPTNASGSTVGAGNNGTSSICGLMSDTTAALECQEGIGALDYNTSTHTVSYTSGHTRPSSGAWDSGAYQFSAGSPAAATPTFSPVAGTYSGPQVVAISTTSGSVICYTTDGTTPATNGGAGCNAGNLYLSTIGVSATETVNAVAGGTGFSDSTVASAAYVINGVTPRLTGRLLAKY